MKSFLLFLLSLSLLTGTAGAAEGDVRWHVVLAAVGNEQNVFDNFVNDFGTAVKSSANVASFTELHASIDERWRAIPELRYVIAEELPTAALGRVA